MSRALWLQWVYKVASFAAMFWIVLFFAGFEMARAEGEKFRILSKEELNTLFADKDAVTCKIESDPVKGVSLKFRVGTSLSNLIKVVTSDELKATSSEASTFNLSGEFGYVIQIKASPTENLSELISKNKPSPASNKIFKHINIPSDEEVKVGFFGRIGAYDDEADYEFVAPSICSGPADLAYKAKSKTDREELEAKIADLKEKVENCADCATSSEAFDEINSQIDALKASMPVDDYKALKTKLDETTFAQLEADLENPGDLDADTLRAHLKLLNKFKSKAKSKEEKLEIGKLGVKIARALVDLGDFTKAREAYKLYPNKKELFADSANLAIKSAQAVCAEKGTSSRECQSRQSQLTNQFRTIAQSCAPNPYLQKPVSEDALNRCQIATVALSQVTQNPTGQVQQPQPQQGQFGQVPGQQLPGQYPNQFQGQPLPLPGSLGMDQTQLYSGQIPNSMTGTPSIGQIPGGQIPGSPLPTAADGFLPTLPQATLPASFQFVAPLG